MFELTYKNLQVNNIEKYSENYKGNNICILKGPNDSGKTTVLSMIKLAPVSYTHLTLPTILRV